MKNDSDRKEERDREKRTGCSLYVCLVFGIDIGTNESATIAVYVTVARIPFKHPAKLVYSVNMYTHTHTHRHTHYSSFQPSLFHRNQRTHIHTYEHESTSIESLNAL